MQARARDHAEGTEGIAFGVVVVVVVVVVVGTVVVVGAVVVVAVGGGAPPMVASARRSSNIAAASDVRYTTDWLPAWPGLPGATTLATERGSTRRAIAASSIASSNPVRNRT